MSCYLLALLRAYAQAMTYTPPPPPADSSYLESFVLGRMKGVAGGYKTLALAAE